MSDLHNVEAEQALLGALLLVNDALMKVGDLRPQHFHDPVHGRIFSLARDRINAGQLASPVTLKFAMQDDPGLRDLGGAAYLAKLAGAAVAVSVVGDYAAVIVELWTRRALASALDEAHLRVTSGDGGSVMAIAADLERDIADVVEGGGEKLSRSFLASSVEAIRQIGAAYQGETPPGVPTGLRALDDILGTLREGRFYLLGGRPSMGKTAAATSIALNAALAGHPVGFASLEMPDVDLTTRALSLLLRRRGLNVPYFDIERGQIDEAAMRATVEEAKASESLPIHYVTREHREITALSMAARALKRRHGIELLVVDYLQLIEQEGARSSFDRVSAASKAMKRLAMDLSIPVLALAQLSRAVEERDDKRPRLSDLRASGELEEDADTVMFAYRDEYYLERNKPPQGKSKEIAEHADALARSRDRVEIIVAKNRSGPVRTAMLHCEVKFNLIEDVGAGQQAMDFA